MSGILGYLHRSYRLWKAARHRRDLARMATLGEGFCKSMALPETAVLSFRLQNRSGDPKRVRIGRFCNLSASILMDASGTIEIGDYVYWNGGGQARIVHGLKVGSRCMLGPDVVLWDTDNHPLSRAKRRAQAEMIPKQFVDPLEAGGGPIAIGDDVWLCMRVLVLGGVTIGDGSVVAANSVVTQDVPPMSLSAGSPARVIKAIPL